MVLSNDEEDKDTNFDEFRAQGRSTHNLSMKLTMYKFCQNLVGTKEGGKECSWCHGPCSVTFFLKNNQRTAPTEPPMMAASPLFSATITTGHLRQTYIGAPSEYFLHSATTNKTCILIIVITNQDHVLSTAAQPEPHHAPHTFHVPGQSHHTCTSSRGHESWSPQGLARIYVGILWHHPEYESPHYMFILLPYALHNNSLYVYVLLLYKYSSLLYVFR